MLSPSPSTPSPRGTTLTRAGRPPGGATSPNGGPDVSTTGLSGTAGLDGGEMAETAGTSNCGVRSATARRDADVNAQMVGQIGDVSEPRRHVTQAATQRLELWLERRCSGRRRRNADDA